MKTRLIKARNNILIIAYDLNENANKQEKIEFFESPQELTMIIKKLKGI